MFPNASAKPLIIPPAIAGEQAAAAAAAALRRGSEAICLEDELIFSLDRKWKVMQAALMCNVVTFTGAGQTADRGSTFNQMLSLNDKTCIFDTEVDLIFWG